MPQCVVQFQVSVGCKILTKSLACMRVQHVIRAGNVMGAHASLPLQGEPVRSTPAPGRAHHQDEHLMPL